jgi:hypothetical protein
VEKQNQNYDYSKREYQGDSVYNFRRPSQSFAEQLVSAKLVANAYADANNLRPPIPNIGRVPNRFGYRTTTPGILDILSVDDTFSASFGDFSGTESGYQGTSFPQNPSLP